MEKRAPDAPPGSAADAPQRGRLRRPFRRVVEAGAEEGADGEAYIGLSTSADGVSWRPWTRVLKSERDVDLGAKKFRYRSLDQPVCGLLRREGRTTLYVQREVAGIYSPSQDCCNKPRTRLEAVDVSRWVA